MGFRLIPISMTLNDFERPQRKHFRLYSFSRSSLVTVSGKKSSGSIHFSDVQIVHKFAWLALKIKKTRFQGHAIIRRLISLSKMIQDRHVVIADN